MKIMLVKVLSILTNRLPQIYQTLNDISDIKPFQYADLKIQGKEVQFLDAQLKLLKPILCQR